MKLQHIAVIFVVIIMPISLVMSQYIQTQIDTITLQTQYTNSLNNATYDALKAFQINSVNNRYSSLSDSKIRDIEASINTFYNSLGVSMNNYSSSKEDLSAFIPAILFNLYDGYYIYSSYNNIYKKTGTGENEKVQIIDNNQYQHGLKPYIYYSCEYNLNGNRIIVNYTLDNCITVYGDFGNGYESRSGYLINYTKVQNINKNNNTLKYDGIQIGPEILTEHLITVNDDETTTEGDYNYIIYKNQKVYKDPTANSSNPYFWYNNYKKTYLQSETANLEKYLRENNLTEFKSINAFEYYYEAYNFSKWLIEETNLDNITQANLIQNNGRVGAYKENGELYLSTNTDAKKIFATSGNNDPFLMSSTFNEHRMAVIRKSIETNLTTAIANYNIQGNSNFEFALPVINEENWYKITNSISIAAFMQGIPIGQKLYNNYSVMTNTKNEETVNEQSLYLIAEDSSGNLEYHQPGCKELIEKQKNNPNIKIIGYTSLSFLRQTVKVSEGNTKYFYPQARVNKTITGCYNCIVNANVNYNIDDIVEGTIKDYSTGSTLYTENQLETLRKAYFTALARERKYTSNLNGSVDIDITE